MKKKETKYPVCGFQTDQPVCSESTSSAVSESATEPSSQPETSSLLGSLLDE